jgi:hypothetical protein
VCECVRVLCVRRSVHAVDASAVLQVLVKRLDWRSRAEEAPLADRARVAAAVTDIAAAAVLWPTHRMHDDICKILEQLHLLVLAGRCPAALKARSQPLGCRVSVSSSHMHAHSSGSQAAASHAGMLLTVTRVQPLKAALLRKDEDGGEAILPRLLTRACSVPLVFEDRRSEQRLTAVLHDTAIPCAAYFANLAATLVVADGAIPPQSPSPVLALPSPSEADPRHAMAFAQPMVRPGSLEAAALSRKDPGAAAGQVQAPQMDAPALEYSTKTIQDILAACARVRQANPQLDVQSRQAIETIFRHLGRRWASLGRTEDRPYAQNFAQFLFAHSKCQVRCAACGSLMRPCVLPCCSTVSAAPPFQRCTSAARPCMLPRCSCCGRMLAGVKQPAAHPAAVAVRGD